MLARRLALAVLLAATLPAVACSYSTELRRVRVPRDGVELAYDLGPGKGFEGELHVGNTVAIQGLDDPLSQTATCDVNIMVIGPTTGGTEVRATFTSLELDWDLPPAATYSTSELVELAHSKLRGMQVRFVVRPDGRIETLPEAPAGTPAELADIIETLMRGLDAFFIPLPPEPLRRRGGWSTELSHTTAGGLERTMEQTLELQGMFVHRDEELRMAKLEYSQKRGAERRAERGTVKVEREVRGMMLFSTDGYPMQLDRETREFDPEEGMVFRKVRAQWSPVRGAVPELLTPAAAAAQDVQVISDPCNPDYVGPAECKDDPPEELPEDDDATEDEAGDATDDATEDEADDSTEADDDDATEDEAGKKKTDAGKKKTDAGKQKTDAEPSEGEPAP